MDELKKVWTNSAKAQLKAIYENYKVKYLQGAKAIICAICNPRSRILSCGSCYVANSFS